MTTWETIFGMRPPVEGLPAEFIAARNEFEARREAAQGIVTRFAQVQNQGVTNHLEGEVGRVFNQVVDEVASSLADLPRVSREAHDVLDAHLTRLRELRSEASEALARARTAWNSKNRLENERPGLADRVSSLRYQIRSADADDDTTSLENQLTTAERGLQDNQDAIDTEAGILRDICNPYIPGDGEYHRLRRSELTLEDETAAALGSIDLGELRDPNWFQSLAGALGDFALGILESVANLLEALITGDWATFFWELRNLLNAAILILGTIALFTGVGAPLFFLSLAAFAVTTGLYITQTPNPQTGETLGLGDVALSAVGVVFSAGGAFRNFNEHGMKLFTGLRNSSGQLNGGLFSTVRNVSNLSRLNDGGRRAVQAAQGLSMRSPLAYEIPGTWSRYVATPSAAWTTARVTWGATGMVGTGQRWSDISLGPLDHVTRAGSHDGIANASGGYHGWNFLGQWYSNQGGGYGSAGRQGTPLFGPPATPVMTNQVICQVQNSPEVHVIPAGP